MQRLFNHTLLTVEDKLPCKRDALLLRTYCIVSITFLSIVEGIPGSGAGWWDQHGSQPTATCGKVANANLGFSATWTENFGCSSEKKTLWSQEKSIYVDQTIKIANM